MTSGTTDLTAVLVEFGRELRAGGVVVGTGQVSSFTSAAVALDPGDLADLYWAGRTCLVTRREDLPRYDAAFLRFFLGIEPTMEPGDETQPQTGDDRPGGGRPSPSLSEESQPGGESEEGGDESEMVGAEASVVETLRHRSFAEWTEEELARLPDLVAAIEVRLPLRETRRSRPSAAGTRLDLRSTVRRSLRHEGELLDRAWRARRRQPRPVVLLMDVSGSMSAHSRALLHFAHALAASGLRMEVFCFGTRLTRVTPFLRQRLPDRAVEQASAAIADWAGGTRIGESLAAVMRDGTGRSVLRGAVVLLASDGLERGDPELLGAQTARLARLAHTVVWLNPLRSDPSYQPLARGMKAALPHIDHLVAADNLDDLEQVARSIPRLV